MATPSLYRFFPFDATIGAAKMHFAFGRRYVHFHALDCRLEVTSRHRVTGALPHKLRGI